MKWVPFTAYIRIEPSYGSSDAKSKRLEYWRDMQKLAVLAYEALDYYISTNIDPDTHTSPITIADPGGGQRISISGFQRGGMGGMAPGTAVKPQIGQSPAQLTITGFYRSMSPNIQPWPNSTIFQGGNVPLNPTELLAIQGPGAHPWDSNPVSIVSNEAAALKIILKGAFDDPNHGFPTGTYYSIFRLEYSGIIYGDRGLTTNNSPISLDLLPTTVAEGLPIGTLVGTFTTVDAETPAGPFVYILSTGYGSADNASFTITGDQLKTNVVFTFVPPPTIDPRENIYSICVRSTDPGGLWSERAFDITVTT